MLANNEIRMVIDSDDGKTFQDLLNKIDKDNPASEDLERAIQMAERNPHLCRVGLGVEGSIIENFFNKVCPNKANQVLTKAECLAIRRDLGYFSSNQIERLLIDQISLCRMGLNYVEQVVSDKISSGGFDQRVCDYWQDTLTKYQSRYLRAIETLARVRKLSKGIAFQVNIATDGGQQVNVNEINK